MDSSSQTPNTNPTPTPAPESPSGASTPFGAPTAFASESSGKGKTIALVCTSVLAVLGLAFGGFEFYQNSQLKSSSSTSTTTPDSPASGPTSVSDLKVELKNSDGTITTLDTDQISINSDTRTLTISESPLMTSVNGVLTDTSSHRYEISASWNFDDNGTTRTITIGVNNGTVSSCAVRATNNYDDSQTCTIAGTPSEIADIQFARWGNGLGTELILFLAKDGSISYIPLYKAWRAQDFSVRGTLPISAPVTRIRDISAGETDADGHFIGSGTDTAFQLADGSYVFLSDFYDRLDV